MTTARIGPRRRIAALAGPWIFALACNAPIQFGAGTGGAAASGGAGGIAATDGGAASGGGAGLGVDSAAPSGGGGTLPDSAASDTGNVNPGTKPGACARDGDCPAPSRCDDFSGICEECLDDNDCDGDRTRCDSALHQCVECGVDGDCGPGGQVCRGKACVPTCSSALECPATAPTCDVSRGICIRCSQDGECAAPFGVCNVASGQCVVCTGDTTCVSPLSRCDRSRNLCVQCLTSADCHDDEMPLCNPVTGVCVEEDGEDRRRGNDAGR